MTVAGRLGAAALTGFVCGMRSAMGPAVLARRGRLGGTNMSRILLVAAIGEVVADKTPVIPPRTSAPALGARILSGAVCGRVLAGTPGMVPGALGALTGTFGAYRARAALGEAIGAPDPLLGVAEDALALTVAALATRGRVRDPVPLPWRAE
jgi:uncharacterized membrane protein